MNIGSFSNVKQKVFELTEKNFLFGFNLANDFIPTIKEFHKHKLRAKLLLKGTEADLHSVDPIFSSKLNISALKQVASIRMNNPLWEDPNFNMNNIITWQVPNRKFQKTNNNLLLFLGFFFNQPNFTKLGRISRKFDLVISTPPGPIYFHKHKNSIIYDAGAVRSLLNSKVKLGRMAAKSYQKAKAVIYTNPDTEPLLRKLRIKNLVFIPFAVEFDKYKRKMQKKRDDFDKFKIFLPSRQNWLLKGNHNVIHAFANLCKKYGMKLIITTWGADIQRSYELVKKLKITDEVEFVPAVNKEELIKRINSADVIADQFVLGSYGLATLEAMACEKPVLIYLKEKENKKAFGELPPIVNCRTVKSIEDNLLTLYENRTEAARIGREARKWVIKKHNPKDVFYKHINLFHKCLFSE